MPKPKSKVPEAFRPMVDWGLVIDGDRDGTDGDEAEADCPACLKERHLHVNPNGGVYNCKVCDFSGNPTTYMEWTWDRGFNTKMTAALERLAEEKKLPVAAYTYHGVAYDAESSRYFCPVYNERNRIVDLRHWTLNNTKPKSTWGVKVGLWGMERLADHSVGDGPVYVVEGESDGFALDYVRRKAKTGGVVVALPGVNTFKKDWVELFAGHEVVLLFDNDIAGEKGTTKAARLLSRVAKSIHCIAWPDGTPDGFDVRDFVTRGLGT